MTPEGEIFSQREMDGHMRRKVAKKGLGVTVSSAVINEGTKDTSKSLSWLGMGWQTSNDMNHESELPAFLFHGSFISFQTN